MDEDGMTRAAGTDGGVAQPVGGGCPPGSPQAPVLPLYLVLDWSEHMAEVVGRVHDTVDRIISRFHDDPVLSGRVRLTLIYFDEEAQKGLDWGDMTREWPRVPVARARGSKSYREGVWRLNGELARHIDRTTDREVSVLDPVAFVVTSDAPDDGEDWSDALERVKTGTTPSTGSRETWRAQVACFVYAPRRVPEWSTGTRPVSTVEQMQRLATGGCVHTHVFERADDFVEALFWSVTGTAAFSVESGWTQLVPPGAVRR